MRISGNEEGLALRDLVGTISHEAAIFLLSVCLLAWLEGPHARLIFCGGEDPGDGSTTRARTAVHWHADEPL